MISNQEILLFFFQPKNIFFVSIFLARFQRNTIHRILIISEYAAIFSASMYRRTTVRLYESLICPVRAKTIFINFAKKKIMEAIVVIPKSKAHFNLIQSLIKEIREKSKVLTDDEIEQLGLFNMMKKVDLTKTVSRNKIMKNLEV